MDYTIDLLDLVHTRRLDDDRVDRIHFRLTVWVLVFGASIVFLHSYAGDPIECWAPGEWPEPWIEYANEFCFIESMYNAPLELDMDYNSRDPKKLPVISYYAWMPFLLAGQALAFFLPYFLWTSGNRFSGIFIHAINHEIRSLESRGFKPKSAGRSRIANHIFFAFQQQHGKNGSKEPVCSTFFRVVRWVYRRFKGCMGPCGLSVFYLFIKSLYFSIAAGQLYFVLRWVDFNGEWFQQIPFAPLVVAKQNRTFFPRIGTCDLDIRHLENDVVRYTLQCVLRTNVINQQIFVFMAWWLAGLMCLSALNIFQWLFLLFLPTNRLRFVRKAVHEGRALNLAAASEGREQKRKEQQKKLEERHAQLERRREQLKADLRRPSSPNSCSDSEKREDVAGCSTHSPPTAPSPDCPLSAPQLDALAHHVVEWELEFLRTEFLTGEHEEDESCGENVAPEEYFAQLPEFADFLGADGFLLFRLMAEHTSKLATIQILAQVYDRFRQHSNL